MNPSAKKRETLRADLDSYLSKMDRVDSNNLTLDGLIYLKKLEQLEGKKLRRGPASPDFEIQCGSALIASPLDRHSLRTQILLTVEDASSIRHRAEGNGIARAFHRGDAVLPNMPGFACHDVERTRIGIQGEALPFFAELAAEAKSAR